MLRRFAGPLLFALALLAGPSLASAQTCRGPLPPGLPNGLITKTTTFDGVSREVCIYQPSGYVAGTPIPLVLALHGGGGNASVMYRPPKRIPTYAESETFLAVFPNGLADAGCPSPCSSFHWEEDSNLGYMDHVLALLQAEYTIDPTRIFFIGFSGGARLIYRLIAANQPIASQIRAIATVAGGIGRKPLAPPGPWSVVDLADPGLADVSALLVQGALDPVEPATGGLDSTGTELSMSFRTKVDAWRVLTGTAGIAGVPGPGSLPAGVTATTYRDPASRLGVVEIVDADLGHDWPSWDLMQLITEFFKRS